MWSGFWGRRRWTLVGLDEMLLLLLLLLLLVVVVVVVVLLLFLEWKL